MMTIGLDGKARGEGELAAALTGAAEHPSLQAAALVSGSPMQNRCLLSAFLQVAGVPKHQQVIQWVLAAVVLVVMSILTGHENKTFKPDDRRSLVLGETSGDNMPFTSIIRVRNESHALLSGGLLGVTTAAALSLLFDVDIHIYTLRHGALVAEPIARYAANVHREGAGPRRVISLLLHKHHFYGIVSTADFMKYATLAPAGEERLGPGLQSPLVSPGANGGNVHTAVVDALLAIGRPATEKLAFTAQTITEETAQKLKDQAKHSVNQETAELLEEIALSIYEPIEIDEDSDEGSDDGSQPAPDGGEASASAAPPVAAPEGK